jgi:redox-sensitive bicupin YhaK (pirin superfamily)
MNMMTNLVKREVARIDSPQVSRGMTDAHRVRQLVPPGDWGATDPFLLLMEDWFPIGVFDRHPHRGMETVTYVIDGRIEHYDNHGNKGTVVAGDAMWMTAGRGLIHNEQPFPGETVHLLQLWINLPRTDKLVPAHHQTLHVDKLPVRREPGAEIRVFSGASGPAKSSTGNHTPVTMVEVRLEPHAGVEQDLPAGFNAFAVVLDGGGTIGSPAVAIKGGQVAWLTPSDELSTISFNAGDQGMRALLFAGQPLREPVAAHGPFVMNTDAELAAAIADLRAQGERFGL